MSVIALRVKNVFDKEHTNQQNYLLADVTVAVGSAWIASFGAALVLGLLGALQSHSFPWSNFFSLVIEFLFIVGLLSTLFSLPALARYLSWRVLVASLKLLADHIRRGGRVPLATLYLPLTWLFESDRHQIAAYRQQLRQRQAHRPPDLWAPGKAPLKLFQQAALLLAP